MRLKLSSTRNPSPEGVATSMRQLLVPRSSAAKAGPENRRGSPGEYTAGSTGASVGGGCMAALSSLPAVASKHRGGALRRIHPAHMLTAGRSRGDREDRFRGPPPLTLHPAPWQ